MHEEAGDAPLRLPGELGLPRPVAAQAYLRVAPRVYVSGLDEPAHYRAVREFDAEDLGARVGVRVEVNQAYGSVRGGAGAHVRLGDGVVPAEDHRDRARPEHLCDGRLYGGVGADGIRRQDQRVTEIHDPQLADRVDPSLELRARRAARGTDRAGRETRARTVGHEVVRRRADYRHVHAREVGRILRVGNASEGEQASVIWFLAHRFPALQGIYH